ncbi:hypothetical protein AAH979_35265 [Plantactinospora sp. ZYX-F-223]|uniref:hypothetical protein n=1 Tax=Plantactinospora sp. ZYX-F-223 TaxID=3144103 RepID=UPI0031FBD549
MSEQRRADHVGYVRAVVGDLGILDVEIDKLVDLATESPLGGVGPYTTGYAKRASGLYVRDCYRWPWHEYYRWTRRCAVG